MYLIVGLGNPEEKYAGTRHNMGFDTINELAKKYQIELKKNKFQGIYETAIIEGKKVMLLKPQTYMNLSGESIREVMNFFGISLSDLLVIYDDMDIEKGMIKIRKKGGPGSHNGMKSVIDQIGTNDFARIRVGIGKPEDKYQMIDYVIGKVPQEEQQLLKQGTQKATEAIITILKEGIDQAMNQYN